MYGFAYRRPASLAEAAALLAQDPDAKALAGGQTLIPALKQRLAQPSKLVDLARLPELHGVRLDGGRLTIGAATRHADVAADPTVRAALPGLANLAAVIGDRQVRNMGTLGGSVANADPAADYPAALLALGADVVTDRRTISAEDFFTGMFETALAPDEVVAAVVFPTPERAAYAKFPNPASRYAVVGVFVARFGGDDVRVAVTGAGPSAFRLPAFEAALAADFSPAALDGLTVDADGLNDDLHADAAYRAHLTGVMARRAVAACAGQE